MDETWKTIEGFENYKISNLGKVISYSQRNRFGLILKPKTDRYGYLAVTISNRKKPKYVTVHRLVALAFIPNPENKATVNHKDGNRKNNVFENLEWATVAENNRHSWRSNLRTIHPNTLKALHQSQKIKIDQFDLNGNFIKTWNGLREAARGTNSLDGRICQVCKGVFKKHRGFIWKYHIPSSAISNSLGV